MIDPMSDASVSPPERWCDRKPTRLSSAPAMPPSRTITLVTSSPSRDRHCRRSRRTRGRLPRRTCAPDGRDPRSPRAAARRRSAPHRGRVPHSWEDARRGRVPTAGRSSRGAIVSVDMSACSGEKRVRRWRFSRRESERHRRSLNAHDPGKGFAHTASRRSSCSTRRPGCGPPGRGVVRTFVGSHPSSGAGGGPRRRRSRPSSPRASPSTRTAARPQRRHRLSADARTGVLARRRRSPGRPGLSRAQRPSPTARRQLRCRLGLRAPHVVLHDRPARDHRARKHPDRGRSRARARSDRLLPHPQPLVAAVPAYGHGGDGAPHARRQGSGRESPAGARPRRREPRALRSRAAIRRRRPRSTPPQPSFSAGRCSGVRGRS